MAALKDCRRCPGMAKPVVMGEAVISPMLLVGQAPGVNEPVLGRPFAWTAGKTMFRWFQEAWDVDEKQFRSSVYMAAVCRCYPGKNPKGGDRVPDETEIENCAAWLKAEIEINRPRLILAVGKLAIKQFVDCEKLNEVVGRLVPLRLHGQAVDLVALPHPSGASTWHRMEPGKTLLRRGLKLVREHPAFELTFKVSV